MKKEPANEFDGTFFLILAEKSKRATRPPPSRD
jgi:hypothetical protein